MTNRINHIDIAKGIGIILVVIGHSKIMLNEELFNIVYSFHVPLFFLLSGIFLKTDKEFSVTFIKRFDSLLKPYFSTMIIIGIYYMVFKSEFSFSYYLGVLYGNGETIAWVQLWFLPHLFLISLFSLMFILLLQFDKRNSYTQMVILLLFLLIGYLILPLFWHLPIEMSLSKKLVLPGLPFSMDILFITTFYFILGYTFREKLKKIKFNYLFLTIAIAIFASIHLSYDVTIDLNQRRYDNVLLSTILALSGSYIIIMVSKLLSKSSLSSLVLSYVGENTIMILIFHGVFLRKIYDSLNNVFNGHEIINSFVAIFLTLLISLVISQIINKVFFLKFLYQPAGK